MKKLMNLGRSLSTVELKKITGGYYTWLHVGEYCGSRPAGQYGPWCGYCCPTDGYCHSTTDCTKP